MTTFMVRRSMVKRPRQPRPSRTTGGIGSLPTSLAVTEELLKGNAYDELFNYFYHGSPRDLIMLTPETFKD